MCLCVHFVGEGTGDGGETGDRGEETGDGECGGEETGDVLVSVVALAVRVHEFAGRRL